MVQMNLEFHCFFQFAHGTLPDVSIGDRVFAKHKNGRYYKAKVTRIEEQVFYAVDFDDGSFTDNIFPEDIVVCICLSEDPACP